MNKYELEAKLARCYSLKFRSSAERDIPFQLSFHQYKRLMLSKVCHYTGRELVLQLGVASVDSDPFRITLDRVDSAKGYTKDNTVPCAYVVNQWKNLSLESSKIVGTTLQMQDVFNIVNILTKRGAT